MMRNNKNIYTEAMGLWGPKDQRLMLAEECSELAAAVHHYHRNKITMLDLCSEIADVEIMIAQMRVMYAYFINVEKTRKLNRLKKIIANTKKN